MATSDARYLLKSRVDLGRSGSSLRWKWSHGHNEVFHSFFWGEGRFKGQGVGGMTESWGKPRLIRNKRLWAPRKRTFALLSDRKNQVSGFSRQSKAGDIQPEVCGSELSVRPSRTH